MALHNHQAVPPQIEPPAPTHTLSPDSAPARSDHGSDANSIAQGGDSRNRVNDPGAAPWPRKGPNDVRYFFDRSGDKVVCNICR